jgi:hypothetical protein
MESGVELEEVEEVVIATTIAEEEIETEVAEEIEISVVIEKGMTEEIGIYILNLKKNSNCFFFCHFEMTWFFYTLLLLLL